MYEDKKAPAAGKQTGAGDNPGLDCQYQDSTTELSFIVGYPSVGTPDDAGLILGLRADAIRQLCREGKLRAIKCGNLWRIPRDWLVDFVLKGGTSGHSDAIG